MAGRLAPFARVKLAEALAQRGLFAKCVNDMIELMREKPYCDVSELAADAIVGMWESLTSIEQLITLLAGFSGANVSVFRQVAELALKNSWKPLETIR